MKKLILVLIVSIALLSSCMKEEKDNELNNNDPTLEEVPSPNDETENKNDSSSEETTPPKDDTENKNDSSSEETTPSKEDSKDNNDNQGDLTVDGEHIDDEFIWGPPAH